MIKLPKILLCEDVDIISEKEMMYVRGGYNFLFYCYCTEDGHHWADWMTPKEANDSITTYCGDVERGLCTTRGPIYF